VRSVWTKCDGCPKRDGCPMFGYSPSMSYAAHDLPRECFPLTIEAIDAGGVVVWLEIVDGPGALRVPSLAKLYGPVSIRVTYANGEVMQSEAPS
jgi:hypothetical protein